MRRAHRSGQRPLTGNRRTRMNDRDGRKAEGPLPSVRSTSASHPMQPSELGAPTVHPIAGGTLTSGPGRALPLSVQAALSVDGIERGLGPHEPFVGLLPMSRRVPVRVKLRAEGAARRLDEEIGAVRV